MHVKRSALGAGSGPVKSNPRLQRLNRDLWHAYEGVIRPGTKAPLAFVLRARTEQAATLLSEQFKAKGYEIVWIKRKWWPSRRRWEVAAKTSESLELTPEAIDRWSASLLRDLEPYDAFLTHWVPAGA